MAGKLSKPNKDLKKLYEKHKQDRHKREGEGGGEAEWIWPELMQKG